MFTTWKLARGLFSLWIAAPRMIWFIPPQAELLASQALCGLASACLSRFGSHRGVAPGRLGGPPLSSQEPPAHAACRQPQAPLLRGSGRPSHRGGLLAVSPCCEGVPWASWAGDSAMHNPALGNSAHGQCVIRGPRFACLSVRAARPSRCLV